jgi:hypothetical protein
MKEHKKKPSNEISTFILAKLYSPLEIYQIKKQHKKTSIDE